jgi:hypothetical protein
MAKLTSKERNSLPTKMFIFPKTRSFPIPDKSHARAALSRASAKGPATEAKVRAAVSRKFPGIGKDKSTTRRTKRNPSHFRTRSHVRAKPRRG